jgi:curved DNA-binding protein CbpA
LFGGMENYYSLLGVDIGASQEEIKKAFRERAKKLHPDVAGISGEEAMRRLLTAYKALTGRDRPFPYSRVCTRFSGSFDYPSFLRERKQDPVSQAKLVFYLLLHPENETFDPLAIWTENGSLDFPLWKCLEREDWLDCAFLLAEELDKQGRCFEAFSLLVNITREERRRPYFKHFMEDVELFLRELTRFRLKAAVSTERYASCLESLLPLGFPRKDKKMILRLLAAAFVTLGKIEQAQSIRQELEAL